MKTKESIKLIAGGIESPFTFAGEDQFFLKLYSKKDVTGYNGMRYILVPVSREFAKNFVKVVKSGKNEVWEGTFQMPEIETTISIKK